MSKKNTVIGAVIDGATKKVTPFNTEKKPFSSETAIVVRKINNETRISWAGKVLVDIEDKLAGEIRVKSSPDKWPATGTIDIESKNGNKRQLKLDVKKISVLFSNMPNNEKGSTTEVSVSRKVFDKAVEEMGQISVEDVNKYAKTGSAPVDFE